MVFYPSGDSGNFSMTVSRLQPGQAYTGPADTTIVADANGDARFSVFVDGRTAVYLKPVV